MKVSTDTRAESDEFKAVARKHPFSDYTVTKFYQKGQTIADILDDIGIDREASPIAVSLDGDLVNPNHYDSIEPKPNTEITIRPIPMGGGDDKIASTVLSVAILALNPGAALAGKTLLGSTAVADFAAGIINAGLMFAVNSIFGPQRPSRNRPDTSGRDKATPTITGQQNEANRYGVVPKIYGKTKVFPVYGATPVTEASGTDQYLRMLFVVGYGPLKISDIKIGETDIDEFDDINLEVREGFDDDPARTIFTNDVEQNDLNIELTEDVGFQTRTTTQNIDEISIDIEFPSGLAKLKEQGGRESYEVEFRVEYNGPETNNNWNPIPQAGSDFEEKFQESIDVLKGENSFAISDSNGAFGFESIDVSGDISAGDTIKTENFSDLSHNDVWEVKEVKKNVTYIFNEQSITEKDIIIYYASIVIVKSDITLESISSVSNNILRYDFTENKITINNNTTSLFKRNYTWSVQNGQYDVRIKRITEDAQDKFDTAEADRVIDSSKWSKLQSIRHQDPIDFDKNLATIALRIKASGQLNGVIDKLSCKAESVLPNYDGNDWNTEEATRNPASHFRDVIIGNANSRDLDTGDIDESKIEDFHDYCENNGFEFNAVYDQPDTPWQVLDDILSVARGSRNMTDGLYSLVFDQIKDAPVQHFTPRNSFNFEGNKKFPDRPDGLKIGFRNENKDYTEDERIVYDDGFSASNATQIQEMKMKGVTNPEQVYKLGRYHLATMSLRPEKFTFRTDIEHIVCSRGDMIRYTHDVPQIGLNSGRVKDVTTNVSGSVTSVDIDEQIDMDAGNEYVARFRNNDANVETEDSTILVDLETNPNQSGTLTFEDPQSSPKPEVGDLFQFGLKGKESLRLLVESIEPRQDLEAKITCTNYAPEVLNAADSIPEFDSLITRDGPLKPPAFRNVQSQVDKNNENEFITEIIVSLEDDVDLTQAESLQVEFKDTRADRWTRWNEYEPPESQFTIDAESIEAGRTYDIRVRKISPLGLTSPWSEISHTVIGDTGRPANVQNFDVDIVDDTAYLSWDAVETSDLAYYKIKHSKLTSGANWGDASTLIDRVSRDSTSTTVPATTGTYMIKAIDTQGLKSKTEARAVTTIAKLDDLNVVETAQEDPNYSGTKTNMIVMPNDQLGGPPSDETQVLTLNGSDQVKDWDEVGNVDRVAYGVSGIYQSGTYNFDANPVDLGNVYTSRLTADVEITGQNVGNLVALWDEVGDIQEVGQLDPSDYSVNLQERHTDDDPNGSPTWTDWSTFSVGDIEARAFEFRLKPTTTSDVIRPKFTKVRITIDMPDRVEGNRDIQLDASGETITFDKPFNTLESIGVTIDDAETGDYTTITNKNTSGFDLQIKDSNDNGVSRQIDWQAIGYGRES